MRLDAFRTDRPCVVRQPSADFSRLPFVGPDGDVSSSGPYLGETVVNPPFSDGLTLGAGIHLHWALPAALRRSLASRGEADDLVAFPAIPTLWRVIRSVKGRADLARSWIVESDYVHPLAEGPTSGAVCLPVRTGVDQGRDLPFRFIGRALDEVDFKALDQHHETLRDVSTDGAPLTAIGYGDPSFSAFYPDCHSVLGFHDRTPPPRGAEVSYHVFGWYREAQDDFTRRAGDDAAFAQFLKDNADGNDPDAGAEALRQRAFGHTFDWAFAPGASSVPDRMLCYARLDLREGEAEDPAPGAGLSVAIGNTASEALAAHLARSDTGDRSIVEDQLEALELMPALDHLRVDTGPKFQEARHSQGFQAVASGRIYQFRATPVDDVAKAGRADPQGTAATIAGSARLPHPLAEDPAYADLAHELNALNLLEMAACEAEAECDSMRRQTFADWSKYLLCAYPPPGQAGSLPEVDEARYMIENHDLPKVTELAATAATQRARAETAKEQLEARLKLVTAAHLADGGAVRFDLEAVSASRFWQPNEPVVLLAGPGAEATKRHGEAGALRCWTTPLDPAALRGDAGELQSLVDAYLTDPGLTEAEHAEATAPYLGADISDGQRWHGFMLEWQVVLWPLDARAQSDSHDTRFYSDSHIHDSYALEQNGVDLRQTADAGAEAPRPSTFTGISLMTPHAKSQMADRLTAHLKSKLWPFYLTQHPDEARAFDAGRADAIAWVSGLSTQARTALRYAAAHKRKPEADGDVMAKWYATSGYAAADRFLDSVIAISGRIGPGLNTLAQALSGFNAALLSQRQTTQLPVADPLAFADQPELATYRDFAARVAFAVGRQNRVAPEPTLGFSPIRSGRLRLARLRLVDTFGRAREVETHRLATPAISRTLFSRTDEAPGPGDILVPPRVVQPLRLNLRWLSAGHGPGLQDNSDDVETNAHPATSPVCGWLVPNALDNSIAVYASSGRAIGAVDMNGEWRPAPGLDPASPTARPDHPVLARVVEWLLRPAGVEQYGDADHDGGIIAPFLSAVESAQANIAPANFAQHLDLALLMGRPLAVVRARIGLEMQGLPALNPNWELFRRSLRRGHNWNTGTAMIEGVRFPVRLGEHRQLNDGLVGYWLEPQDQNAPGDLGDTFISPQSNATRLNTEIGGRHVVCSHDGAAADNRLNIDLTLSGGPRMMTMLVDPHCAVHATAGIVPTKAITLPHDHYAEALDRIEVSFLTAPVQSPAAGGLALPLPREPGYDWYWRYVNADGWHETSVIAKPETRAGMAQSSSLYEGWLVLKKSKRKSEPAAGADAHDPTRSTT